MTKEKCDNHCETCPVNGQVFCALMFAKTTNQALPGLVEKIESLEMEIQDIRRLSEAPAVLNPLVHPFEGTE